MPKQGLVQVQNTLTALFGVFAGEFDPEQFFADNSQYDLMKLGVQLGRDGEITLARVQEYVEEAWSVSEDDAMTYAVKLFRMLQQLAEECELPFSVEPVKKPRKPRKKKTGIRKTKKKKTGRGRPPKGDGAQKGSKSPRVQALIDACGSETKARSTLIKAIKQAKKNGERGPKLAGVMNLGSELDIKPLKKVEYWQVTGLLKAFAITKEEIDPEAAE